MSPDDALASRIDLDIVIRSAVHDSLRQSLFDGIAPVIRKMTTGMPGVVTWYGQHEAHRVALWDALRRCGRAWQAPADTEIFEIQAALVRSTGWWWPFDDVCVMSERPSAVYTEPAPGGFHDERRLHHPDRPAIEFRDGQKVYAVHGTIVPDWVIHDPTPERIARERSIEVRRTAIERIGWDTYIGQAGLTLIDQSDDPGNDGCVLQLYQLSSEWGSNAQILLATNGSCERDGHRRRYGLQIPDWIPTATDAAAWTYGLRGSDYSRMVRRT
ncbi:DUF6745 domain-containing protein [Gordonia sp. OPL2]|uniref:DUF6745 domain-containing protein n=1 Tax=Gordonia sp. OPL2 TaxID=2486274 RepID=UPI00165572CB|nr:hypothetical protein [Gordonia sp. OPL2]